MDNLLVISIKPEYMTLILEGEKSIELRKCKPTINKEKTLVVLYCTAPVKAVVGLCTIEELIEDNPESLWENFSDSVGIDKAVYFKYYKSHRRAFGLKFNDIFELNKYISLAQIKDKLPTFTPPQTYKYFSIKDLKFTFREELHQDFINVRRILYKGM